MLNKNISPEEKYELNKKRILYWQKNGCVIDKFRENYFIKTSR